MQVMATGIFMFEDFEKIVSDVITSCARITCLTLVERVKSVAVPTTSAVLELFALARRRIVPVFGGIWRATRPHDFVLFTLRF